MICFNTTRTASSLNLNALQWEQTVFMLNSIRANRCKLYSISELYGNGIPSSFINWFNRFASAFDYSWLVHFDRYTAKTVFSFEFLFKLLHFVTRIIVTQETYVIDLVYFVVQTELDQGNPDSTRTFSSMCV